MSTLLTEVLLDLTDPCRLKRFKRDPEEFIRMTGLPDDEALALRDGDVNKLRFYAKISDPEDTDQQFNLLASVGYDTLTVAELHIELQVHANAQVRISGGNVRFIGGQWDGFGWSDNW